MCKQPLLLEPHLPKLCRSHSKPCLDSFEGEVMNLLVDLLEQLGVGIKPLEVTALDFEPPKECRYTTAPTSDSSRSPRSEREGTNEQAQTCTRSPDHSETTRAPFLCDR